MGADKETVDKGVNDTVTKVEKTMHEKGSHDALTALRDDFMKFSQDNATNPDAVKAYWDGINNALNQKGKEDLMGNLTLEYAKDKMKSYSTNAAEVDERRSSNQALVNLGDKNPAAVAEQGFNLMFDKSMLRQFESKQDWAKDGTLYKGEIDTRLKTFEEGRKTQYGKEQLRSEVGSLLATREGQDTADFFRVLDTAKNGGVADNKISQDDINAYVDQANKALENAKRFNKDAQLPEKFDPNNPQGTMYNQEWLKQAQYLQKDENFEKYDDNDGMFGSEHITKDSLASALGYKDAGDMISQNTQKKVEQTETPEAAPEQAQDQKKAFADSTIGALASFPMENKYIKLDEQTKQIVVNRDSLKDAAQDASLTNEQKKYLADLDKNWDQYAKDKPSLDLRDVVKASGYDDATINAKTAETVKTGTDLLNGLSNVPQEGIVKDGKITQQSIDERLAQLQKDNPDQPNVKPEDQPYAKNPEVQALQSLKQNFDKVAHGDSIKVPDDLNQYAKNLSSSENTVEFKGFKGQAQPADAADPKLEEAKKQVSELTQEGALKSGEPPYNLAARTLTERAKLTGEKVDHNAIMREVARLVITNEIGPQSVRDNLQKMLDEGKSISSANLPKALNSVRVGQPLKVYSDGEKEKLAKAIVASKANQDTNGDGYINEDDYKYTGG